MNSTIEDLPSEIIYNIVKDLSYVDQQSFAKSSEKWKRLVALCFLKPRIKKLANYDKNVLLDISNRGWTEDCLDSDLIIELFDQLQFYKTYKIAVINGDAYKKAPMTEIFDLANPHIPKITFPSSSKRYEPCGQYIQGNVVICGGTTYEFHFKDGYLLGSEKLTFQLLEKRRLASSILINENILWIVGGRGGKETSDFDLNTTEFISLNPIKVVPGPELPFLVSRHKLIQFDEKSIYLIGGMVNYTNSNASNLTWLINPLNDFKMTRGPSLIQERSDFACGKMTINGRTYIVVAGGCYINSKHRTVYLDTVEMLDPQSDRGWFQCPSLPFRVSDATMVTNSEGDGVVLCGGYNWTAWKTSNVMLELKVVDNQLKWVKLPLELTDARSRHLCIPVPEDYVIPKST